jgi:hypothetical protein
MREDTRIYDSIRAVGTPALLIILALGCSSPGSIGTPATAGGNGGSQGPISLPDLDARAIGAGGSAGDPPSTGDANCGASISNISQQPVDLLVVLDRSTSMSWDMTRDSQECAPDATTCQQRWSTLTRTLDQVITGSSAKIRWGLKLFATPDSARTADEEASSCAVSPGMEVAVGAETSSNIRSIIQATRPLGYTPTLPAVKYATDHLTALVEPYQRYILLATDGEPNCDGASETVSGAVQVNHVIAAIKVAVEAGIKVYVVGLGPTTNLRNLDKFAVAGGTGHYYPATSAVELNSALMTIVGEVASCVYGLAAPPPDPENIAVYLDKQIVPRDASNGWTLAQDLRSVLITGTYCEGIKAEKFKQVQIYFGCPDSQPPSVIP